MSRELVTFGCVVVVLLWILINVGGEWQSISPAPRKSSGGGRFKVVRLSAESREYLQEPLPGYATPNLAFCQHYFVNIIRTCSYGGPNSPPKLLKPSRCRTHDANTWTRTCPRRPIRLMTRLHSMATAPRDQNRRRADPRQNRECPSQ